MLPGDWATFVPFVVGSCAGATWLGGSFGGVLSEGRQVTVRLPANTPGAGSSDAEPLPGGNDEGSTDGLYALCIARGPYDPARGGPQHDNEFVFFPHVNARVVYASPPPLPPPAPTWPRPNVPQPRVPPLSPTVTEAPTAAPVVVAILRRDVPAAAASAPPPTPSSTFDAAKGDRSDASLLQTSAEAASAAVQSGAAAASAAVQSGAAAVSNLVNSWVSRTRGSGAPPAPPSVQGWAVAHDERPPSAGAAGLQAIGVAPPAGLSSDASDYLDLLGDLADSLATFTDSLLEATSAGVEVEVDPSTLMGLGGLLAVFGMVGVLLGALLVARRAANTPESIESDAADSAPQQPVQLGDGHDGVLEVRVQKGCVLHPVSATMHEYTLLKYAAHLDLFDHHTLAHRFMNVGHLHSCASLCRSHTLTSRALRCSP